MEAVRREHTEERDAVFVAAGLAHLVVLVIVQGFVPGDRLCLGLHRVLCTVSVVRPCERERPHLNASAHVQAVRVHRFDDAVRPQISNLAAAWTHLGPMRRR